MLKAVQVWLGRAGFALLAVGAAGALSACASSPPVALPLDPAAAPVEALPAWEAPADFRQAGGALLEGQVHVVGGHAFFNGVAQHWALDPQAGTWQQAAAPPRGCYAQGVVAHAGQLLATGGLNSSAEQAVAFSDFRCAGKVQVFDAAAGQWLESLSMPELRFRHAAAVVGQDLYIIGGQRVVQRGTGNFSSQPQTALSGSRDFMVTGTPRVWAYNLSSGTWRTVANLPSARIAPTALVHEGRIYVSGGRGFGPEARVDVYDPATDTWSQGAALPAATAYAAGGSAAGLLVLTGGEAGALNPQPQGLLLRMGGDGAWRSAGHLATPRSGHVAVAAGDTLLVLGGFGSDAPRSMERFRLR